MTKRFLLLIALLGLVCVGGGSAHPAGVDRGMCMQGCGDAARRCVNQKQGNCAQKSRQCVAECQQSFDQ